MRGGCIRRLAPVRQLVFAIRTGRSAIPVSAVSLSQTNLRSSHSKPSERTRQGIRESTENVQVTTDHDQFSELLSVYSPATYADFMRQF